MSLDPHVRMGVAAEGFVNSKMWAGKISRFGVSHGFLVVQPRLAPKRLIRRFPILNPNEPSPAATAPDSATAHLRTSRAREGEEQRHPKGGG